MINEFDLINGGYIIGNNRGEFKLTYGNTELPPAYFDFNKGILLNIFNNIEDTDNLVIYYNSMLKRYFAVIVDIKYLTLPKGLLPLVAKESFSSFELNNLLDFLNLKLRKDNILSKKIKRDNSYFY